MAMLISALNEMLKKEHTALHGTHPMTELRDVTYHMDHAMLPATRHK